MIKRLRDAYTPEELAQVYTEQYDHTRWPDHIQRVDFTLEFLREIVEERDICTVADLSCGDGVLALSLPLSRDDMYLGDIIPCELSNFTGPIEETIHRIPDVDLFILSETLEHVDDPAELLTAIRGKADTLVLSTPLGETDDGNPEHYWGWDLDGIEMLLEASGWWPDRSVVFTPDVPEVYYTYQVWMATRDTP
jgi:hypothetical protein